jgi:transposase-like protein
MSDTGWICELSTQQAKALGKQPGEVCSRLIDQAFGPGLSGFQIEERMRVVRAIRTQGVICPRCAFPMMDETGITNGSMNFRCRLCKQESSVLISNHLDQR